jgi:ankyrin repeat protein
LKAADDTLFVLIEQWKNTASPEKKDEIFVTIENQIPTMSSLDIQNEQGKTPLTRAAEYRMFPLMRLFLQYKAHPMVTDADGYRVLDYIVNTIDSHEQCIQSILEIIDLICSDERFDPRAEVPNSTPVHNAIHRGSIDALRALLKYDFDINAQKKQNGWTPLHVAVHRGRVDFVMELLNRGANPLIKNNDERSAYDFVSDVSYHNAVITQLVSDAAILK